MSCSTRARRSAGGGTAVVRLSSAAASRRLSTSARHSGHSLEVAHEPGPLEVVERVDGVGAGQRMDVVHAPTPIVSRRRISPSRIRVLAVPTGKSSMVATSVCV